MKQTNEFEDVTIVAFLDLCGHKITPFKNPKGRIAFKVEGDITGDIKAFYTNKEVRIMDYVSTFKLYRNQIFTMKNMDR